jgi:hypothetical protein
MAVRGDSGHRLKLWLHDGQNDRAFGSGTDGVAPVAGLTDAKGTFHEFTTFAAVRRRHGVRFSPESATGDSSLLSARFVADQDQQPVPISILSGAIKSKA